MQHLNGLCWQVSEIRLKTDSDNKSVTVSPHLVAFFWSYHIRCLFSPRQRRRKKTENLTDV